ncbi:MAG TPA: hypothetical protein VH877_02245 [Polyangia bacterium]|jgi:hypothetical protein|nr:hypothetical protein [Polyangia bacterium]
MFAGLAGFGVAAGFDNVGGGDRLFVGAPPRLSAGETESEGAGVTSSSGAVTEGVVVVVAGDVEVSPAGVVMIGAGGVMPGVRADVALFGVDAGAGVLDGKVSAVALVREVDAVVLGCRDGEPSCRLCETGEPIVAAGAPGHGGHAAAPGCVPRLGAPVGAVGEVPVADGGTPGHGGHPLDPGSGAAAGTPTEGIGA